MAPASWKDNDECEGYSDFIGKGRPLAVSNINTLQHQTPYHSTAQLALSSHQGCKNVALNVPSQDVDCAIVVVRMLMSLGFLPKRKYRETAIMTCARHDFGWRKQADYRVKGMLIEKLFPEVLRDGFDFKSLGKLLSFENLMNHSGIDQVIFSSPAFSFRKYRLPLGVPASKINVNHDPVESSSKAIYWNGGIHLRDVIQQERIDSELITIVPKFFRVYFTPYKEYLVPMSEVLKFSVFVPNRRYEQDGVIRDEVSRVTYNLCAAVKLHPSQPLTNPSEVRVYDANGRVIQPIRHTKEQAKPDSKWQLGDPEFKFMLFYSKHDPPQEETEPYSLIFSWDNGVENPVISIARERN